MGCPARELPVGCPWDGCGMAVGWLWPIRLMGFPCASIKNEYNVDRRHSTAKCTGSHDYMLPLSQRSMVWCVKHQTETLSFSNAYIVSNTSSGIRCETDSVPFPNVYFMYTGVIMVPRN